MIGFDGRILALARLLQHSITCPLSCDGANLAGMSTPAEINEYYGPFAESGRDFDVRFWQEAGDEAIFEAARGLILDYILLREGHADQPRLQRTVESFQRL
jgi:hypothetical protein